MYCPVCFEQSLVIQQKGVVQIIVNGIQKESGRFLFFDDDDRMDEMMMELIRKLNEFFQWYRDFKNKDEEQEVDLVSTNFYCMKRCSIPMNSRFSVIGALFKRNKIEEIVDDVSNKYGLNIKLK
jgi:hypothetical protein